MAKKTRKAPEMPTVPYIDGDCERADISLRINPKGDHELQRKSGQDTLNELEEAWDDVIASLEDVAYGSSDVIGGPHIGPGQPHQAVHSSHITRSDKLRDGNAGNNNTANLVLGKSSRTQQNPQQARGPEQSRVRSGLPTSPYNKDRGRTTRANIITRSQEGDVGATYNDGVLKMHQLVESIRRDFVGLLREFQQEDPDAAPTEAQGDEFLQLLDEFLSQASTALDTGDIDGAKQIIERVRELYAAAGMEAPMIPGFDDPVPEDEPPPEVPPNPGDDFGEYPGNTGNDFSATTKGWAEIDESFTGTGAIAISPAGGHRTVRPTKKRKKDMLGDSINALGEILSEYDTKFAAGNYSPGDGHMPSPPGKGVAKKSASKWSVGDYPSDLSNSGKEWPRAHKSTAAMGHVSDDGVDHEPAGTHETSVGNPRRWSPIKGRTRLASESQEQRWRCG